MTQTQIQTFLQMLSKTPVKPEHAEEVYQLIQKMGPDVKEKFLAFDIYRDIILKEAMKNEETN
jgi:hypothetical protein